MMEGCVLVLSRLVWFLGAIIFHHESQMHSNGFPYQHTYCAFVILHDFVAQHVVVTDT